MTLCKIRVAGISNDTRGKLLFNISGGLFKKIIAIPSSGDPSLLVKLQVRAMMPDTPRNDHCIVAVDPFKNVNLVPLGGGFTFPEQKMNYLLNGLQVLGFHCGWFNLKRNSMTVK